MAIRRKIKTPKPVAIDCKALDLADLLQGAIDADVADLQLRISRYDSNLEPTMWQAIAKFSNANIPWECCVTSDPERALKTVLYKSFHKEGTYELVAGALQRDAEPAIPKRQGNATGKVKRPLRKITKRKGNGTA